MSTVAGEPAGLVPEPLEAVVDLIEIAGRLKASTAIVPGGHRVEDLRLVESARDHGIVDRIILVGKKDSILSAVNEVAIEIPPEDIVEAGDDDQIAAATVELIKAGGVDIVLKGGISTPIMNRHMLPLAVRPTVSLATVFDAAPLADGRPMVMTDAGVTTVCNFGRMVDLVRNSVDVARVVGIERPRVAILSANEKQIPSLPSTKAGIQLARRNWPDAIVCGPLSFDLATDPGSVAVKGMPDLPNAEEVAGCADVLVCPGIDTANVLYKTIAAMNKFGQASLASITVGFPVPYIILSRSDSLETRLVSIALCAVYARRFQASPVLESSRASSSAEEDTPRDLSVVLREAAQRAAREIRLPLEDTSLIVACLDEGGAVAAVQGGEIVDANTSVVSSDAAVESDPSRGWPSDRVIDCVTKEVGRAFVAAGCDVEAIVLTGVLANDRKAVAAVRGRVGRLAPVMVVSGAVEASAEKSELKGEPA